MPQTRPSEARETPGSPASIDSSSPGPVPARRQRRGTRTTIAERLDDFFGKQGETRIALPSTGGDRGDGVCRACDLHPRPRRRDQQSL